MKHLKRIAIDEISIGKRHRYLTVVMDIDTGAVVFVGDGKGANNPTDKNFPTTKNCFSTPFIGDVMEQNNQVILEVKNLKTYFFTQEGVGKAVDGVSFRLQRGKTLGLVGESGCGKSITALSILRLIPKPAARIIEGQIIYKGEDLLQKSEKEMRRYRGSHISMILQDPTTALNPVMNIGNQVIEAIRSHQPDAAKQTLKERAIEKLRLLGIPEAENRLRSFPHQFSGGMRQRVVGGIALSCEPEVLIADEPTTSLDVTIQAQFLRLLRQLQQSQGLSIIFITHDFGIVARMCDSVAVLYAGKVVEMAPMEDLLTKPAHPYTRALLESLPIIGSGAKERMPSIEGYPPSIFKLPQGCSFAPRCHYVMQRCQEEYPSEVFVGSDHVASCWRLV